MALPLIPIAKALGAAAIAGAILLLRRTSGQPRRRQTKKAWDCNCNLRKTPPTRNLYVIRLHPSVWRTEPNFQERNPNYRTGKPCVYVGETAHKPGCRFQQHKNRFKAARMARKYGECLLESEYAGWNPVRADQAKDQEEALAGKLQAKGYGVWWN